ncbi:MAG: branched-chain amino acid aminotransferase [Clostridia bacterium]|jgi:branched-chain amino acid aminotransferase|nr:branched-chain amino acid aminotransferase [Clostridia bacterium]MDD4571541.1 branched-chain amino acid aminotransferase [Clostridia bacterium]
MLDIKVTPNPNPKAKPDQHNLGFGKHFTDHMFIMDYTEGIGWHDARIVPFGPIPMDPATMVLHYAQETFEGLKAYRTKEGKVLLFRPEMNAKRMNASNQRLCMPEIPVEDFVDAVKALVKYEDSWIPTLPETSLYIRPFVFATEAGVGVHPANSYKFIIITTPVGAYYPEGVNPIKIYVEDEYVRAVPGGTGFTKCGGNYAASIRSQKNAADMGYTQVLWLDGRERKYIEEVGTMNVMFKMNGEIYTAPLDEGSILPGVTRDSIIHLLKDWGYKVNERKYSIDEVCEVADNGKLEEVFGTGTAAVISPVGELNYKGKIMRINDFKTGELTQKLYDALTAIQWGNAPDKFSWTMEVK